jgi:hypothetical protein
MTKVGDRLGCALCSISFGVSQTRPLTLQCCRPRPAVCRVRAAGVRLGAGRLQRAELFSASRA